MKQLGYVLAGACMVVGLVATPAVAGSGVGGVFNLGKLNTVNAMTSLSGTVSGAQLNVANGSSSGGSYGVFGKTTSANATSNSAGVRGTGSGNAAGVYGTQSNGTGVLGWVTGGTGVTGRASTGIGVLGVHGSSGVAPGVEGSTINSVEIGASGVLGTGNGTYGVLGETAGGGIAGVMGRNSQPYLAGVQGCSDYGGAANFVPNCWSGLTYTAGGTGGFFIGAGHDVGNGRGVYAEGRGAQGIGIEAQGQAYAGKFTGNVYVNGTLSKTAGSFRIDNPLDPAHSYLQHSFVESPDMKNVYDGLVVTNKHGFATVRMPRWFGKLNRTFRYQLTIVGRSFAQAIVWKPLAHDRFTIRTNQPRVRVSWQVTGIRHDPYANAYRTPVIIPKPAADQGKYLNPQLYGKPRRAAIRFMGRSR